MRTRSSSNLIVESFTIPKRRNRRRSKQIVEPVLQTFVKTPIATMADTRTMSELLQAPIEGYGDAIVIPAILAKNFELKVGLLTLVTSSQFHGFERDDPHSHIRWFNKITSTLKYKNVPHEAIKLMFSHFLLREQPEFGLKKNPLVLSIHGKISFDETFSEAWDRFKDLLCKCPHHGFLELHQIDTFYNALTQSNQDSLNAAAGRNLLNRTPRDALTIIKNKSKRQSPSGLRSLPSNTVANPRGNLKAITTRSGVSYDGPMIPPTSSPLPKKVEREPEATKDKVQTTNLGSTAHVQPPVVQVPIPDPDVAPKPNPKPSIPYPLRLNDQKIQEKANNQMLKFLQIFQRLHFDLSFADALLHMPNFASTLKSLLSNKEKLFELANTPLMRIVRQCSLRSCPKNLETPKSNHTSSGSTTSHSELSLPDYEVFCFEEKSSGSTTTNFDYSFPEYDVFYFDDDHIEEKSSSSTTTHSDFSLPEYDSFIFDLSIDPFPPANRSTFYHEEFADELALLDPFPQGNKDDNFNPDIDRENSLLALDDPFLLDTPPPGFKLFSLEEVENFDPSLSLNWSEMITRMANIPSLKQNEDECFDPGGGEINADIPSDFEDDYYNSEGDIIYLKSLLNNDTIPYLPPEVFLEHVLKSLNEEPNIDDLNIKENVRFTFEDRHYLSLTFVIKIFLPFLTYLVNYLPLISSENEDLIFDHGISAYSFYSLEPMAYENPMIIFPFFCFCPKDKGIRGEISPDYEDSLARGFVHRSLKLQSFACLYIGIRYPRS
ncbi:hypothetical protein Tco_1088434 [Tanacetum coccineum]